MRSRLEAAALSDRTLCFTLWPSNEPATKPPAVPVFLLPYETSGRQTWSSSEPARTLEMGFWRVRVQNGPLTIHVENNGGRLVQNIAFDDQTAASATR